MSSYGQFIPNPQNLENVIQLQKGSPTELFPSLNQSVNDINTSRQKIPVTRRGSDAHSASQQASQQRDVDPTIMNKPTNYTTMPAQFNINSHAKTRTQKMQDIVERMIKLTDFEDSIIEDSYDDDSYEETTINEIIPLIKTQETNSTAEIIEGN